MSTDLLTVLVEATAATSAAALLVLLLRQPLRRVFGAGVAYAAWLLVPAALAAVLLPAPVMSMTVVPMAAPVAGVPQAGIAPMVAAVEDRTSALLLSWAFGVIAAMAWFVSRQWRFRRALGAVHRRDDGLHQAESTAGLPAAFGLWRPMIVVPQDFDRRYSAEERQLMHAHERVHIERGDLHCNAAAIALRSLFWFNPLLHLAWTRFRHDQELACDQRVIARHPHARRAYGEAMFKTQLAAQLLPIGCHWGPSHPLKERIEMLKQPMPTRRRWRVGVSLLLVLTTATGVMAWAAQPASTAPRVVPGLWTDVSAQVQVDQGAARKVRMMNPISEGFALGAGTHGEWVAQFRAAQAAAGLIELSGELRRDGVLVSSPRLKVAPGREAAIDVTTHDGAHRLSLAMRVKLVDSAQALREAGPLRDPAVTGGHHPLASATAQLGDRPAGVAPAQNEPVVAVMQPLPSYPPAALAQRIGGRVMLLVDVGPDGRVTAAEVAQSTPAGVFDAAAIEAVRQWWFQPKLENGKPVSGRAQVPVDFAPNQPAGDNGA